MFIDGLKYIYVSVFILLLSGCANMNTSNEIFVEGHLDFFVDPSIDLKICAFDKRPCRSGFGIESTYLFAKVDLSKRIYKALDEEFSHRNFNVAESGVTLEVVVEQFFCEFAKRQDMINCFSELVISVSVLDCNEDCYYTRKICAVAEEHVPVCEQGNKAKVALDASLKEAISILVNDMKFQRSIIRASKNH